MTPGERGHDGAVSAAAELVVDDELVEVVVVLRPWMGSRVLMKYQKNGFVWT